MSRNKLPGVQGRGDIFKLGQNWLNEPTSSVEFLRTCKSLTWKRTYITRRHSHRPWSESDQREAELDTVGKAKAAPHQWSWTCTQSAHTQTPNWAAPFIGFCSFSLLKNTLCLKQPKEKSSLQFFFPLHYLTSFIASLFAAFFLFRFHLQW